MSKIIFDNNTPLPAPDGPNMISRNGSLPTTSYLDCFMYILLHPSA